MIQEAIAYQNWSDVMVHMTDLLCSLHKSPIEEIGCRGIPYEWFPILLIVTLAVVCFYPERKRNRAGR